MCVCVCVCVLTSCVLNKVNVHVCMCMYVYLHRNDQGMPGSYQTFSTSKSLLCDDVCVFRNQDAPDADQTDKTGSFLWKIRGVCGAISVAGNVGMECVLCTLSRIACQLLVYMSVA